MVIYYNGGRIFLFVVPSFITKNDLTFLYNEVYHFDLLNYQK